MRWRARTGGWGSPGRRKVIGDPRSLRDARTYYSAAAYDALRGDHGKPGVTVLDGTCDAETIKRALSPARAAAVEGGGESRACTRLGTSGSVNVEGAHSA